MKIILSRDFFGRQTSYWDENYLQEVGKKPFFEEFHTEKKDFTTSEQFENHKMQNFFSHRKFLPRSNAILMAFVGQKNRILRNKNRIFDIAWFLSQFNSI